MTPAERRARAIARQWGRSAQQWIAKASTWPDRTRQDIAIDLAVQNARYAARWAMASQRPGLQLQDRDRP